MIRAFNMKTRSSGKARSRARVGLLLTAGALLCAASASAQSTTGKASISGSATSSSTSKSGTSNRPNAVLFNTAGPRSSIGPLDSVIQAQLEKLNVVIVAARPGMDLPAVQLAIDCVSETPQCLRSVATQTQAQILIAPSLQSTPTELVLSILRFDTSDNQMKRVARRQTGTAVKSETLDSVSSMLRELFNIPEPPPQPAVVAAETKGHDAKSSESETTLPPIIEPPQEPAPSPKLPLGPFLLAGGGALVLGGGAIMGAVMLSTQDDYNTLKVNNERQASKADDLKDQARTQAAIANVLYGVGGAMIVAGGIWLAVALSQPGRRDDWQTAVVPAVGPGQLGFAVVHRGGVF